MKNLNLIVASALVMLLVGGCADNNNVEVGGSSNTNTNEKASASADAELSFINIVTSSVNGQDVALKSVHFAFDKYSLSDTMRKIEKDNYAVISPIANENSNLKIKIEGNCDEWGTDEYNYALGLKRAKIVKDALVSDGISASKITLVSFGESNPLCTDKTEKCWKQNRRVDHKLLP